MNIPVVNGAIDSLYAWTVFFVRRGVLVIISQKRKIAKLWLFGV